MNRKNVIRAFIQYFSYWIRVVTRAISHTVVIVGGFFTIVLTVGIPFFLSVQSKPYVSVAELLQREDMGTAVPFLVIGIIVVIFYFSIVPVQLYIEQEKKLNTLKFEKQQLIESVQPKLDLCFDDTNATSRFALGNNQTLFRFRVKNISIAENVEQITVTLKNTNITPELPLLGVRLMIMHNYDNRLNSGDYLFYDCIIFGYSTNLEGVIECSLSVSCNIGNDAKSIPIHFDPMRNFIFTISASGVNTSPVEKTFEFYSELRDNSIFPNIRELDKS